MSHPDHRPVVVPVRVVGPAGPAVVAALVDDGPTAPPATSPGRRPRISNALIVALVSGTMLNPLNSSMVAVALPTLQRTFGVGVAGSSWLITAFYLSAAVSQPLMGRLVDHLGARRMFLLGLVVVLVTSLLSPAAPAIGWLVALRVVQAVGTSTAFPAAMVVIRRACPTSADAAAGLSAVTTAAVTCAALGPVVGGVLVAVLGWEAVFLVNVPVTLLGLGLAWRTVPRTPGSPSERPWVVDLDVPGIVLFSGTLSAALVLLVSFARQPAWWLLPPVVVLTVMTVGWELRAEVPFIDLRWLAGNRRLAAVLAQQACTNLVYYGGFFVLPLWLQSSRAYGPGQAGLFILPMAGLGVVLMPAAVRLVARRGSRNALLLGSVTLLAATSGIQLLDVDSSLLWLVVVVALLGVPTAFDNLGLQTSLFEAAGEVRAGQAGGLFQTCRFLGAISATAAIAISFERQVDTVGLHQVGWVMSIGAVVTLALAVLSRTRRTRAAA